MKISRRSFINSSAAAAAAMALPAGFARTILAGDASEKTAFKPGPGNKWPGRVVINFNKNAVTLNGINPTAVPSVIGDMVNASILKLTGQTAVGAAWKAVFPSSLAATSTIAVKVPLGCANSLIAPHWSSVRAITDGLQQMDFNGARIPAANITIYDMRCRNNLSNYGYTAANFPGIKLVYDTMGTGYTDGARGRQYATSLRSTFLINVFRPGGHGKAYEGFTLGFKNHYGSYEVDHNEETAPGYLRDINGTGVVFDKTVLSICVGIFGAQEASGSPHSASVNYYNYASSIDGSIANAMVPPTTIIMSTDPVTAEMQAIKMMRLNKKPAAAFGANDMPRYLRASAGITGALPDKALNFGVIDEKKMDIRRIINGV
ncbi:MAG TPA: hypothetical protein VLX68_17355 [Chitinivibrionales bacterium]|nr:hypothetical protein [Chitinivibrionales bacterium]